MNCEMVDTCLKFFAFREKETTRFVQKLRVWWC